MTSEVGALGGSVLSERYGGLNSSPVVIISKSFPKHGSVKLHSNSGVIGCCVVVLMIVVEVIDAVLV